MRASAMKANLVDQENLDGCEFCIMLVSYNFGQFYLLSPKLFTLYFF